MLLGVSASVNFLIYCRYSIASMIPISVESINFTSTWHSLFFTKVFLKKEQEIETLCTLAEKLNKIWNFLESIHLYGVRELSNIMIPKNHIRTTKLKMFLNFCNYCDVFSKISMHFNIKGYFASQIWLELGYLKDICVLNLFWNDVTSDFLCHKNVRKWDASKGERLSMKGEKLLLKAHINNQKAILFVRLSIFKTWDSIYTEPRPSFNQKSNQNLPL